MERSNRNDLKQPSMTAMSNELQEKGLDERAVNALASDPERARLLATPIERFHKYLGGNGSTLWKILFSIRYQFHRYYFGAPPKWRMALRQLASDRVVPDFASIGAVRSGTSALSQYILQHPCVVLPIAKEPLVILPTRRAVLACFPRKRQMDVVRARFGLAITGYCAPVAPDLAWPYFTTAINPECKILLILRNPIDRVFSQWRWDNLVKSRWSSDSLWHSFPEFDEAVRIEIASAADGGGGIRGMSGIGAGYLGHSIYLPFVRTLYNTIGRDRIHIIQAEDFFEDPLAVVRTAYDFLGLPPYHPSAVTETNAGPAMKMNSETRERLRSFFRPRNERLYDFLGRDFGWDR